MSNTLAGIFLQSLTWTEAELAMQRFDTIVLPIGARCKEHGLHLPLNTDWLVAEYLAKRVAEQCRVMVLPTLQYGCYPAFVNYSGSVSIGAATFSDCVCDICHSFSRHGTRRFYMLNIGISTIAPLAEVKRTLNAEGIEMEFSDLRQLALAERKAVEEQRVGTHADELETSMMLYIAPQAVHMARAVPELAPDAQGPLTRDASASGLYSTSGAWGDPTLATREKGERIVEAIVRDVVAAIGRTGVPPTPSLAE